MISISQNNVIFSGCTIVFFVYVFKFFSKSKNRLKEHNDLKHEFMRFIFSVYCILVISKVYFPINFSSSVYLMPAIWLRPIWSLMQVYTTTNLEGFLYQILGNLVLLAPLSFFALYFKKYECDDIKGVILLCLKVTLFIEFSQIALSILIPSVKRYFEINDIILNTSGGLIGYYVFKNYSNVLLKWYEYKKEKK